MTAHATSLIACCALTGALTTSAFANTECSHSLTRQINDALVNQQHQQASTLLKQWDQHSAPSPLQPLLQAALLIAEADRIRQSASEALPATLLEAIEHSEAHINQHFEPTDAKTQLSLGFLASYRSLVHISQQSWLKAAKVGQQAQQRMRALLQAHPEQAGAYFVMGIFEYSIGSLPGRWRWLAEQAGYVGDRQRGLDYLERALTRSERFAPEAARFLLLQHVQPALLSDQSPEPVCRYQRLARDARTQYPKNRSFSLIDQILALQCSAPEPAELNAPDRAQSPPTLHSPCAPQALAQDTP